jgi:hypothetical protein
MSGDFIKFYKNKIVTGVYDEFEKKLVEVDIRLLDYDLSYYFNNYVEFDEGLTVEDFLIQLSKYEKLIDLTFESYTNSIPLCLYLKEIYTIVNEKQLIKDIKFVEFYKEINIRENVLVEFVSFRGIINRVLMDDDSLNITPLKYWKHLNLKINNNVTIYKNTIKNGKVHDMNVIIVYKDFTLFEILSNFFLELTVCGDPSEVEIIYKEINTDDTLTDEIKEEVELLDQYYLINQLDDAIKSENYEEAKKLKDKIENKNDYINHSSNIR